MIGKRGLALVLGSVAGMSAANQAVAGAVTLLSDDFNNATVTNGILTSTVNKSTVNWYMLGSTSALAVKADGGSNALYRSQITTPHAITASFSGPQGAPLTLDVGDQLTLSFTIHYATTGQTTEMLRLGLFNSNTSPVTANNSPDANNDSGYFASLSPHSSASDVWFFRQEQGAPLTGKTINWLGHGTPSSQHSFGTTNVHTLTFSIERTDVNAISLTYARDSDALISQLTPTADMPYTPFTAFDSIYIGSSSSATSPTFASYFVDNISVTYSAVPEPGTVALAMGVVGLALARRERTPLSRKS